MAKQMCLPKVALAMPPNRMRDCWDSAQPYRSEVNLIMPPSSNKTVLKARNQLLSRGLEPAATTPEEFVRHIGAEAKRWSKVIRESGIRAE
jgi:hypothetical protein